MLRNAIEEPSRRASSAAIVSIFAFFDLPVRVLAVHWWLARRATAASGLQPAPWWIVLPCGARRRARLDSPAQRAAPPRAGC